MCENLTRRALRRPSLPKSFYLKRLTLSNQNSGHSKECLLSSGSRLPRDLPAAPMAPHGVPKLSKSHPGWPMIGMCLAVCAEHRPSTTLEYALGMPGRCHIGLVSAHRIRSTCQAICRTCALQFNGQNGSRKNPWRQGQKHIEIKCMDTNINLYIHFVLLALDNPTAKVLHRTLTAELSWSSHRSARKRHHLRPGRRGGVSTYPAS